jgi:hypothetical protein
MQPRYEETFSIREMAKESNLGKTWVDMSSPLNARMWSLVIRESKELL